MKIIIRNHVSLACLFCICLPANLSAKTVYDNLDHQVPDATDSMSYEEVMENVSYVLMPQFISQRIELREEAKFVKVKGKKKKKKKKRKNYGFSGQFGVKHSLKNSDKAVSASVTWKPDPKDYYYFKVGGKHDFDAQKDRFSYSWSIGYDDWHTGTVTTQINHWGGIRPGDGFDVHNSIASVGYKIKSDTLKKLRLKSSITVAKKLEGGSATTLSSSLSWSPHTYWFIKAILVKSSQKDEPKWNYLFGYDDWHPRTFGIEYSNYDGNDLRETNFRKHGKLAITYKWKF